MCFCKSHGIKCKTNVVVLLIWGLGMDRLPEGFLVRKISEVMLGGFIGDAICNFV